jgi:hypothetical protein
MARQAMVDSYRQYYSTLSGGRGAGWQPDHPHSNPASDATPAQAIDGSFVNMTLRN